MQNQPLIFQVIVSQKQLFDFKIVNQFQYRYFCKNIVMKVKITDNNHDLFKILL